jgi:uncharacterized damage-inducible protein DinB
MNRIPRTWMISNLRKSYQILGLVLDGVTQEQAETLRDGEDGWTILEIMCHLRDYQEIFMGRATQMLNEDNPTLTPYDAVAREVMITEREYAKQNLLEVFKDYVETRHKFIALMESLNDADLDRIGTHPMTGTIAVATPVYHTTLHDADHTEQIARILGRTMLA